MNQISTALKDDAERWNEFVRASHSTNLYHDFRWRSVIEESFGHQPHYLMMKEDGVVTGILPLFFIKSRIMDPALISIPFLNYGGILSLGQSGAANLYSKAKDVARRLGAKYIELRGQHKLEAPVVTREHKVTMILKLSGDEAAQWDGLDAKVRNQVRKAEKSGVSVKRGKAELIGPFYDVFSRNMRDLGTPVIGKNFFLNIFKYFPDESAIFIAEYQGCEVACGLTLTHDGITEIPWASSLRLYNKYCPNDLLYWEMIRSAIRSGSAAFDFGRCTKGSSTYNFKKHWKTLERQLYWQYWAERVAELSPEDPKESKALLVKAWKRLPLWAANCAGPLIVKEITTF